MILGALPPEKQADVARRIAQMDRTSPDVIKDKRPDFDPSKVCIRVISNRAASKEDGSIVFNKINSVVMQFLNGSLEYLGYVPSDAMVEKAVRQQKILSIYDPTSKAARSFEEIAKRLLDNESAALDEKRTISHVFSNFFNRKQ